jgi:hypothetical protein
MIWFDCKKCNKTLSRPETSAGALVFCDCGNSLRVPWESTAAPAAETYPLAMEEPLAPVRFEMAQTPTTPSTSALDEVSMPRLRRRTDEIDPDYCFNHPSEPKNAPCADCGLGFCRRCSTKFRGQTVCAPCKNYRTRLQQRRPETARWAVASFGVALIAAPVLLCLTPVLLGQRAAWITTLALLPLFFALGVGIWALVQIGRSSRRVGGNFALGGITLATTVVALLLMVTVFSHKFGI